MMPKQMLPNSCKGKIAGKKKFLNLGEKKPNVGVYKYIHMWCKLHICAPYLDILCTLQVICYVHYRLVVSILSYSVFARFYLCCYQAAKELDLSGIESVSCPC